MPKKDTDIYWYWYWNDGGVFKRDWFGVGDQSKFVLFYVKFGNGKHMLLICSIYRQIHKITKVLKK